MFISEQIAGHYYVAELNKRGNYNMLMWSLVPHAYDGEITRIPFRQVPRKTWRRAYRVLVEREEP